jgi:hypothetical protein
MFIEPHFVGISPTQLSLGTGGPHQQGFINNYKVICFYVNKKPHSFGMGFNFKTLRGGIIHIRPKHFITPPEFGGLYYCYEVFVIGLAKPYLFPPHRNSR